MSTVQPKGERLRGAVKWIAARAAEEDEPAYDEMIEEASLRFNLSPREEEFLRGMYREVGSND